MTPVTSARQHSAPFTLSTIEDDFMRSVDFTHALADHGELVAVFLLFRYYSSRLQRPELTLRL